MAPRWLREFGDPSIVVQRVLELRSRGFGAASIARIVFRDEIEKGVLSRAAAVKRIQRLLKWLETRVVDSRGDAVSKVSNNYLVSHIILSNEPMENSRGEMEFASGWSRLGPTEKILVEALTIYSPLHFKALYKLIRERYHYNIGYKALFEALRRLVKRGLVRRVGRGFYAISPDPNSREVLVENMRNGPFVIWNKKLFGRAALLTEALKYAQLEGHTYPITQVELGLPAPEANVLWKSLERKGLRLIVIYFDERLQSVKVEPRFWDTTIPAAIWAKPEWIRLYDQAVLTAYIATRNILARTGAIKLS